MRDRMARFRAAVRASHAAAVRTTVEQLRRRGAPVELLEGRPLQRATGTDRYAVAMLDRRGGDSESAELLARPGPRRDRRRGASAWPHWCDTHDTRGRELAVPDTGLASVTAAQVVLATNGYTDPLWPGLRRTIVPLFGAIAASAPLAEASARRILPDRPVLYESGHATVYYRIDRDQRLLIGGRGPMREIAAVTAIPHLTRYATRLWPMLEGVEWHTCLGRPARHDSRSLSACARARARGAHLSGIQRPRRGDGDRDGCRARTLHRASGRAVRHAAHGLEALHALWPLAVKAAIVSGRVRDFLGI